MVNNSNKTFFSLFYPITLSGLFRRKTNLSHNSLKWHQFKYDIDIVFFSLAKFVVSTRNPIQALNWMFEKLSIEEKKKSIGKKAESERESKNSVFCIHMAHDCYSVNALLSILCLY